MISKFLTILYNGFLKPDYTCKIYRGQVENKGESKPGDPLSLLEELLLPKDYQMLTRMWRKGEVGNPAPCWWGAV